jgi:uncharacterized membrane protein
MSSRKGNRSESDREPLRTARSVDELTRQNVELIARMHHAADQQRTFAERVADGTAALIGSWPFIVVQTILLTLWMALNVVAWCSHWDPYPFILLNLALSFQAAYAGPIIMMSQNRQSRLSERRNHLDLQINLLAEQETTEILHLLRLLCAKSGVVVENTAALRVLEQATSPENVVRQIEKALDQNHQAAKAP